MGKQIHITAAKLARDIGEIRHSEVAASRYRITSRIAEGTLDLVWEGRCLSCKYLASANRRGAVVRLARQHAGQCR